MTADLAEGARTGQYGHLYIAQMPVDATWGYAQAMVNRVGTRWPVDLLIVDYLALLKTDRKRDSQVAEFSDMLQEREGVRHDVLRREGTADHQPVGGAAAAVPRGQGQARVLAREPVGYLRGREVTRTSSCGCSRCRTNPGRCRLGS